jgi:hypothetical protein
VCVCVCVCECVMARRAAERRSGGVSTGARAASDIGVHHQHSTFAVQTVQNIVFDFAKPMRCALLCTSNASHNTAQREPSAVSRQPIDG